jgi:avidin family protein
MKRHFILGRPITGSHQSNLREREKNERGSEMTLAQTGQSLTGKYESVVSGAGGKITGELSGWANQRLISVSVNWPTTAITAWVGYLAREDGKDAIETLWQMTTGMQNPEDPSELWESVFAGADRFVRVS